MVQSGERRLESYQAAPARSKGRKMKNMASLQTFTCNAGIADCNEQRKFINHGLGKTRNGEAELASPSIRVDDASYFFGDTFSAR